MALITLETGDVLQGIEHDRPFEVQLLCGPCGDSVWRRWGVYKTRSEATREMADAEHRYPMQTFRVTDRRQACQ